MLRTLLISDDAEAISLVSSLVRSTAEVALECVVPVAPRLQLSIALQTRQVDVILLDTSNIDLSSDTYAYLREKSTDIPVVTFTLNYEGINTPFALELPLSSSDLMQKIRAAFLAVRRRNDNVVVVLPAKGGCGATTIAINTAARLADRSPDRVLVCESDLYSGPIADFLDIQPNASFEETLASSDSAEALIWPRHVCRKEGVHFTLTRREHARRGVHWHDYHHLLKFLSKRYDHILFDLPELVDDALTEVVRFAKKTYLVTTPEIPALQLAQERTSHLRGIGVGDSNLRIIVNQWSRGDIEPQQIEDLLACPVEHVLPFDPLPSAPLRVQGHS